MRHDTVRAVALLVVDVQNDFCPGGALAVAHGDEVVAALNDVIDTLAPQGMAVFASRDWHPRDTRHFRDRGGPWPVHCVAESAGAAFHSRLRLPPSTIVVSKGTDPDADGYSAFEGRTRDGLPLADTLHAHGITRLLVGGLATDYCVQASVLDARRAGLEVVVLTDAIRGVEITPGDSARALEAMAAAGAELATTKGVISGLGPGAWDLGPGAWDLGGPEA